MSAISLSGEVDGERAVDYALIVCVLTISALGVLAINSATHAQPEMGRFPEKQAVGIFIGGCLMAILAAADYSRWIPRARPWLYGLNLLCLLLVALRGHASHGAQRWIPVGPFEFQPSELAKFAIIVCLAHELADSGDEITRWRTLLRSLAYIALPILLIFKQPDLGTALVVLTVWFGMALIAGARWEHLTALLLVGICLFFTAWHTPLIKGYQKARLASFLDPAGNRRDTGYHLRQSEIAIGSGGATGEGYLQGMQSNGRFIPEQHTDFIFTIVGEETGLLGCCILIGLYCLMLWRCLAILIASDDALGRLLVAGVVAMLAFHIFVNIGMTVGIMPVTGVPLPFFSYGLSSLIVGMASIGLVLSVGARGRRSLFG